MVNSVQERIQGAGKLHLVVRENKMQWVDGNMPSKGGLVHPRSRWVYKCMGVSACLDAMVQLSSYFTLRVLLRGAAHAKYAMFRALEWALNVAPLSC